MKYFVKVLVTLSVLLGGRGRGFAVEAAKAADLAGDVENGENKVYDNDENETTSSLRQTSITKKNREEAIHKMSENMLENLFGTSGREEPKPANVSRL